MGMVKTIDKNTKRKTIHNTQPKPKAQLIKSSATATFALPRYAFLCPVFLNNVEHDTQHTTLLLVTLEISLLHPVFDALVSGPVSCEELTSL
jgi:hypothetical protein